MNLLSSQNLDFFFSLMRKRGQRRGFCLLTPRNGLNWSERGENAWDSLVRMDDGPPWRWRGSSLLNMSQMTCLPRTSHGRTCQIAPDITCEEKRSLPCHYLTCYLPHSQSQLGNFPSASTCPSLSQQPASPLSQDLLLLVQTRATTPSRDRTNILGLVSCAVFWGKSWLISSSDLSLGYLSGRYNHKISGTDSTSVFPEPNYLAGVSLPQGNYLKIIFSDKPAYTHTLLHS